MTEGESKGTCHLTPEGNVCISTPTCLHFKRSPCFLQVLTDAGEDVAVRALLGDGSLGALLLYLVLFPLLTLICHLSLPCSS